MRALNRHGIEFSIGAKDVQEGPGLGRPDPRRRLDSGEGLPHRGEAQVAEVPYGQWRLIVRRTRLTDPEQLALWPDWRHHCFLSNRDVPLMTADIDHGDNAQTIWSSATSRPRPWHTSPLLYSANSAWTVIAAFGHNLARWISLTDGRTGPSKPPPPDAGSCFRYLAD